MPRPLRIAHGNGHNEASLVQFVKDADADSCGCDESQKLRRKLKRTRQRRVTMAGKGWTEDRNRAKSTCIVTHNRNANIGELTRKASDRLPFALRVAPDRVLVASMYEHPVADATGHAGVAHFELHPVAGPAQLNGSNPDAPIVREYRQALVTTRRWMRAARYDGLLLVLTGDLQMREDNDRPWHPLRLIAGPLHLRYRWVDIDAIMVDRAVRWDGPLDITQLHDHRGFAQNLRPA